MASKNLTNLAINLRTIPKVIVKDPTTVNKIAQWSKSVLESEIINANATQWGKGRQKGLEHPNVQIVYNTGGKSSASYTLVWTDEKAKYLEYGAGLLGEQSGYPGKTIDYTPRATGHVGGNRAVISYLGRNDKRGNGTWWILPKEITGARRVWTQGWAAAAPVYKARNKIQLQMKKQALPLIAERVRKLL